MSRTTVQITRDGVVWSKPEVLTEGMILWKPIFAAGRFWCAGYRRLPHPGPLVTELYSSPDGFCWNKVSPITEGNETALMAVGNRLRAFVRTNASPYRMEIWEGEMTGGPWRKVTTLAEAIQAPHLQTFGEETLLLGRALPPEGGPSSLRRTKIWRLEDGLKPVEIHSFPSGGDTGYTGTAVHPDGSLWVSYYSQHEIADPYPDTDTPNRKPADVFVARLVSA